MTRQQGNSNRMHGSVANPIRSLQKFRSFGCYNISCSSVITYPKFLVFLIQFDKFARSRKANNSSSE